VARKLGITRYELPALAGLLDRGVEVGVDHGHFSYYLLKHYGFKTLWSVDSWGGKFAERRLDAESYLLPFGERSVVLHKDSVEAAGLLRSAGVVLDFAYIDGDHTYRGVRRDVEAWCGLVRPGGLLCGHDYIEARGCGVQTAVQEFADRTGWELLLTREHWASWAFIVP
jgi:hypothetical protein